MRTRADYDRAFAAVRDVIHRWDPYGLLGHAPADEWDNEIASIVAHIPHIKSEGDATQVISEVFSRAFQPDGFMPSDCSDVGRQLFSAVKDLGFPAENS
jgi:hypothetical protein